MNYVKVINKAEILLYSTLISIMSGINQIKDQERVVSKLNQDEAPIINSVQANVLDLAPERSASIHWEAIQQAFLSLLLWTVLGLAAGFLIGMLKHG